MRHFKAKILYLFLLMSFSLFFISCNNESKTYFDLNVISVNGEEVDLLDDLSIDIEGNVGNPIKDIVIVVSATRATFGEYKKGYDVSSWFKNTVKGLRYELQNDIQPPYDKAEIKIYGTPLETQNNQSYDLSVKFNTFIAGTVRREGLLQNLGHYRIGEPDSVILEVLYPQEIQGSVGRALSKSYDVVLHLKKDSTRENLRLEPWGDEDGNGKVLGTADDEKNFINRIDGLKYTLRTTKSEGSRFDDTMIVTVSGTPSDGKTHTEDIRFNIPLTNKYIANIGQYKELKGVNVVQENKVSYNIVDYVPPELEDPTFEGGEGYVIKGTRNRQMDEQVFAIKLEEGTGVFYPKKRSTIDMSEKYWPESRTYNPYYGISMYGIKWECEVKDDDLSTFYIYVSGIPYDVSFKEVKFPIRPAYLKTNNGEAGKTLLTVPIKYHIVQPVPRPIFEIGGIIVANTDAKGNYQPTYISVGQEENFSFSVDNPNFVNNLYDSTTHLFISVGMEDPYRDNLEFNIGSGSNIRDYITFTDTIEYKGKTIPNPLKDRNLRIQCGEIWKDTSKYRVIDKFYGWGTENRFAIIIEMPVDSMQGDTPVLPTDAIYPLCLKISSKAFHQGSDREGHPEYFVDENGNSPEEGGEIYYEISAGENDKNRTYVGVFDRKYEPYIADGAALVYYEDYYTEYPFTKEDNLLIIRPRLSDNASMTLNNGVPVTYEASSDYPDRIGALVLKPEMDPDYPTHIPASSFPDVSNLTRRGFKKVGWSTVMGSGLVDYSTPLNGDNGGLPYKNTIENVAKWGLWLPESASYVWPTPIDYPVSLAWYFDFDHYWTKADISNKGATFIPTFKFVPKSDTANTDVTIKSDEMYTIYDKYGAEVKGVGVYADSAKSDPQKNTTDNIVVSEGGRNYSDYPLYNEIAIPSKGYALPDSYYSSLSKTVPHKLVMDHDFAIGDYFVTGYMHDVLYKWNIGNGTESAPEHGYIIPSLSQARLMYPLDHYVVGYVNPTKLMSYDLEDRLNQSYDSSPIASLEFYNGGALITNSNNVSYGGFSKRKDSMQNGYYDKEIRTRSYPLTWVSFTQAMVICNAFTEYYNEKNAVSLTPAYTTDHSLSWSKAVKKVEDAISMIGEENKDKVPSSSFSWNYDTFANLEATGFRLPTYDEWEFATKIYVDRVDFANEDSELYEFYQHQSFYKTVLDDVTKEGRLNGHHPRAKGYKANVHANRTLGANPSAVSYTVANGSSYPMFLTDNYTPRYYGPYRLEDISKFFEDNSKQDTFDTTERDARVARKDFVATSRDLTQWYGSTNMTGTTLSRDIILPTLYQTLTSPLSNDFTLYSKGPSQIGLHGIGGYVSELTDRFASDNKKALYTTNGTAFVKSAYDVVYYPTDFKYDGFRTFKVHPNVHYPNQGIRLCRTIGIDD